MEWILWGCSADLEVIQQNLDYAIENQELLQMVPVIQENSSLPEIAKKLSEERAPDSILSINEQKLKYYLVWDPDNI